MFSDSSHSPSSSPPPDSFRLPAAPSEFPDTPLLREKQEGKTMEEKNRENHLDNRPGFHSFSPTRTRSFRNNSAASSVSSISLNDQANQQNLQQPRKISTKAKIIFLLLIGALVAGSALFIRFIVFPPSPSSSPPLGVCAVQCFGPLLAAVQLAEIFPDSKTFVDLPLRASPERILDAFAGLGGNISHSVLSDFVHRWFGLAGEDLPPWTPADWQENPKFLENIKDKEFKQWGKSLHSIWLMLGREISPSVYEHPERHTLLPLKHPHILVPGGRFRELYYWDSYWILQGLMVSGMNQSANNLVENILDLIDQYGFVPNGCRRYYLKRSQPPFAASMVKYLDSRVRNDSLIEYSFPILLKEYSYWMTLGRHAVNLSSPNCCKGDYKRRWENPENQKQYHTNDGEIEIQQDSRETPLSREEEEEFSDSSVRFDVSPEDFPHHSSSPGHLLNRYWSSMKIPRPESYREDLLTASQLNSGHSNESSPEGNISSPQIGILFSELAASAESGWDFSSRWFSNRKNLTTACTSQILPVDLNIYLYRMEKILEEFSHRLGNSSFQRFFHRQAENRAETMKFLLWDSQAFQWRDYDMENSTLDGDLSVLSNFLPLFTIEDYSSLQGGKRKEMDFSFFTPYLEESKDSLGDFLSSLLDNFLSSGLPLPGGFVISLNNEGQQWDFPNSWAPMQSMIIRGIEAISYHYYPRDNKTRQILEEIAENLPTTLKDPDNRGKFNYAAVLSYYFASRWVYSNFLAYSNTGLMYEKYYAPMIGIAGYGGEYQVQPGFGWSNGVIMDYLEKYGPIMNLKQIQDYPGPEALRPRKI